MTAHAKNVWESEGRARKCAALCRAIRSEVEVPQESLVSLATFLRAQTDEWWSELSRRYSIRKPSAATIEAVCLSFEADAEQSVTVTGELYDFELRNGDEQPVSFISNEPSEQEPPQAFFDECAKACRCCPICSERPCAGTMAGGVCDEVRCSCFDESDLDDIYQEDP